MGATCLLFVGICIDRSELPDCSIVPKLPHFSYTQPLHCHTCGTLYLNQLLNLYPPSCIYLRVILIIEKVGLAFVCMDQLTIHSANIL